MHRTSRADSILYYSLFSRDLHVLELQWRSPCSHYFLWRLPLCALLLCSMTHYDIKMGDDVAMDAPLWHHSVMLLGTSIVNLNWE